MRFLTVSLFLAVLATSLVTAAPEKDHGLLGKTSAGIIRLNLEITANIRAGILGNTGKASDLKTLLSSSELQELREDESMKLSLCVMSSGGGTFEITAYDLPGQLQAITQYGDSVPLHIGFGEDGQDAVKQRAVTDLCTSNTIVPVTIEFMERSNRAVGRVNGRLSLLVKSV